MSFYSLPTPAGKGGSMTMEKLFKSLTKQQHGVMNVLCARQHPSLPALGINPTTLGSLCVKRLVNVEDGVVRSTCVMEWNMTFHKDMFNKITQDCVYDVSNFIKIGYRIRAIQTLREYTGWGVREAKTWVDFNYPK
jgi:hypothetical protein